MQTGLKALPLQDSPQPDFDSPQPHLQDLAWPRLSQATEQGTQVVISRWESWERKILQPAHAEPHVRQWQALSSEKVVPFAGPTPALSTWKLIKPFR